MFCSVVGVIVSKIQESFKVNTFYFPKGLFALLNLSSLISDSILILNENNECVYLRGWNDDKSQDIWKSGNTAKTKYFC